MDEDVHWLTAGERKAWVPFVGATLHLFSKLDAELKAGFDVSHLDYGIMALLSDAPEQRRRMSELATAFGVDPSNVTYHVRRLEGRGLVERGGCPNDGRVVYAYLTDAGRDLLRRAAPLHVAGVRRHFLDHLAPEQIRVLGAVFETLRAAQLGEGARSGA